MLILILHRFFITAVKMNWSILPFLFTVRLFSLLELNAVVSALISSIHVHRKNSFDPLSRTIYRRKATSIRDTVSSPSLNGGGSAGRNDGKQGISSATFNLVKAWCANEIPFYATIYFSFHFSWNFPFDFP